MEEMGAEPLTVILVPLLPKPQSWQLSQLPGHYPNKHVNTFFLRRSVVFPPDIYPDGKNVSVGVRSAICPLSCKTGFCEASKRKAVMLVNGRRQKE
ncbi:hypothetical protein DMI97_21925 [Salmonella enterica]|nr:hypothetical protein [Salmonella enterica]